MLISTNITTTSFDTSRFDGNQNLKSWYKGLGLDGLELMLTPMYASNDGVILPSDVTGMHLRYINEWMSLWNGGGSIAEEYGGLEEAKAAIGASDREGLIDVLKANVADSLEFTPKYLVMHASNCSLKQVLGTPSKYSDLEIANCLADLANEVYDEGRDEALLFENLWWSGMTMLDPDVTYSLLDKVKYKNAGVMLDTGHLLHTNDRLRDLDEASDYIMSVLDRYENLDFIKGIHLHQTLSGDIKRQEQPKLKMQGSFKETLYSIQAYIFMLDSHKPYLHPRAKEIVERINPDYLTLEVISSSKEEHEGYIKGQLSYL